MKTEAESSYYRIFLKNLIVDITEEIPNTHQQAILTFNSTKESLWYQAPELLDNTLHSIYSNLQKYIPLNNDDSNNPQWVKNIKKIWGTALHEINEGLEVGASVDEVAGPTLSTA